MKFIKSEGNFESKNFLTEYLFDEYGDKFKRIKGKNQNELYWRCLTTSNVYDKNIHSNCFEILEISYFYFKQNQREEKLKRILNIT